MITPQKPVPKRPITTVYPEKRKKCINTNVCRGILVKGDGPKDSQVDEFIAVDDKHAIEWLSQGFVTDKYTVKIISYIRTDCCRQPIRDSFNVQHEFTASEFLKFMKGLKEEKPV